MTNLSQRLKYSALLLSVSLTALSSPSAEAKTYAGNSRAVWTELEIRLKQEKFSPDFIALLRKKFSLKNHEKVLRLNTLGFLKSVDHQDLVTDLAVQASRRFLEQNSEILGKAETLFGVDKEVISALLWIETRHGSVTGRFHVPSVYASLLVANSPRSRRYLKNEAKKSRLPASLSLREVNEKILTRTDKKSLWASGELRELDTQFYQRPSVVRNLKGSFAGAFGIPQFIPTSYQKLAFTDRENSKPDLSRPNDAVLSVANYLKQNGWAAEREGKEKALYHYNNSRDYVQAILTLSEKLKKNVATN